MKVKTNKFFDLYYYNNFWVWSTDKNGDLIGYIIYQLPQYRGFGSFNRMISKPMITNEI
jgi:hypothetical protein